MAQILLSSSHASNNFDFNIDVDEITENDPRAENPICNIRLKPHQLTLLHRCIKYENNEQYLHTFSSLEERVARTDYFKTNIGVIADRVGSGKSYVMLSLILSNNIMNRQTNIVKSAALNHVTYHFENNERSIKTSMIVIPHNLCYQWETYIAKFGGNLKYKMINKTKAYNTFLEEEDKYDYDVVLVSSTYYNKLVRIYLNKRLQRIFYDEVDNLSIPGCYHIKAAFYWFVTASYGNLLYPRGYSRYDSVEHRYICCANGLKNSGYVRNIFNDLYMTMPRDLIKVLVVKNAEGFVEDSLQLSDIHYNIIKCKTPQSINVLHGLVDRNIIQSLNAGDLQGALRYIHSSHRGSEENIITIIVEKWKNQLSNFQVRLNMTNDIVYEDEREREIERASLTKKIEETQKKIDNIVDRIKTNELCAICYEDFDKKTITTCCQNAFCFKCIHLWLGTKATCPSCRSQIMNDSLYVIDENAREAMDIVSHVSDDDVNEQFDKYKNLEILLKKRKGGKFLIFSSYDSSFGQIIQILNRTGLKYDFIKGNANQIRASINRYKNGIIDVLLVNTTYYGTGMNLENTTDIIMFHKFDTQLEQQVIGRAHRLGRTDSLNVHYLLHQNELNT